MKKINQRTFADVGLLSLSVSLSISLLGCEQQSAYSVANPNAKKEIFSGTVSENPGGNPDQVVCDPLAAENVVDAKYGLQGRIRYLNDDQPRYSNVTDYFNFGNDLGIDLFLGKLFVPTRPFSAGFTTTDGDLLKKGNGEVLVEYFSLHLSSLLALADSDMVGNYQLALLSDDGAVLKVELPGTSSAVSLVNNDGTHSTKLACAETPLALDRSSKIPMRVDYYQGPRYHIALNLLWRPWSANASAAQMKDSLCGSSGNGVFWDDKGAATGYADLLKRGWKPIDNKNFLIAQGSNKCVVAQ